MKKIILLAGSLLSLAFASNAAEKEVYVIKNGKMVNANFVPSSEAPEVAYEIEESANAAGDAMVKVKNPADPYKAGLLYLPEAIDLDETWNMVLEYYFEEGTELTAECAKRECWRFDLMADTLPVKGATWATNSSQAEYRIGHVAIDARMRDFYDNKGKLDNHGLGQLRSVTKYVYSSRFMPKEVFERGDANKVKAIFLAMFPEAGAEIVGYIKTLKFVSDGIKPFYADKMTILNGEGTIYMTGFSNYCYATNNGDTSVGELSYEESMESPNKMYGQQLFVSQSTDGYYNQIKGDRMYCDNGEQGEVDFYDTEYGFLPFLTRYDAKKEMRVDEDGIICDAQLRIPFVEAANKTISIAMRLGHNAGATGDLTPYADYIEKSNDIRFPVEYRFESGDAKKIASKTEWKQFRPTYTKGGDDYVDSIPTMMSMVYGDVEIPSSEYNYITLRFMPNDVISFMFGDIRLTGDQEGRWSYKLGEDYQGNKIPIYTVGVDNVVAKGAISIYPNPASDVITVTNEGVKSVAVYTVAGTLVASSESNVVSVASLANGIYVVKADTEAGVITGQIIKK